MRTISHTSTMNKLGGKIEAHLRGIVNADNESKTKDDSLTVVQVVAVTISEILIRQTNTQEKLRLLKHYFTNCIGRLDDHAQYICDGCKMDPIVGAIYMSSTNVELCEECYTNMDDNTKKRKFRRFMYPWQYLMGDCIAPNPPLRFRCSGVDVMFLQHCLTKVGYLARENYDLWCGFYGAYTVDAVRRFGNDHNLPNQKSYDVNLRNALVKAMQSLPPSS